MQHGWRHRFQSTGSMLMLMLLIAGRQWCEAAAETRDSGRHFLRGVGDRRLADDGSDTTTTPTTTSSLTETVTSTATNATLGSAALASGSNGDGGMDEMTIVLICALVAAAVLIFIVTVAVCTYISKLRANRGFQHKQIRMLDDLEEEYEARKDVVRGEVESYIATVDAWSNQPQHLVGRHQDFLASWIAFLSESTRFLEEVYTPALRIRRDSGQQPGHRIETSQRRHSVGTPGAGADGAPENAVDVSIPRLRQERRTNGFLPRPGPVTPPAEVKRQLEALNNFHVKLDALVRGFYALQDEMLPLKNHGNELPLYGDTERHRDPRLEEEVDILRGFTHPLMAKVTVKRYGVLGAPQGERDPRPGTPLEVVVVDPAGWHFIGRNNNPKGAGGASGSIYNWLSFGRGPEAAFPQTVHEHFSSAAYEAEAETRAKFNVYGPGQYCIHVIGPKVSEVLQGVSDLSHTYLNILSEFCQAQSRSDLKVPRVLRMLPVSSGIFLSNKKLDRHMPQITSAALSLAFSMMPIAMHEQLRNSDLELCIFQLRDQKAYEDAFQFTRGLVVPGPFRIGTELGRVPQRHGGYDWVRQKNGPADRLQRLGAMLLTQCATCSGGYELPGARPIQLDLKAMRDGTRVLIGAEKLIAKANDKVMVTTVSWDGGSTVMEAASQARKTHDRVVAVNAASAFHVGGGVLTGGRHALEETWCTISTLLHSLQEVQWKTVVAPSTNTDTVGLVAADHSHGAMHVPVDGCILSPEVVIFRDISSKGYAFQANETKLAGVCSVAMFNMNPRVSDSPVDAPRDFNEYCRLVKHKFRAVVAGAAQLKAEVLVIPDVGCGVFDNDPSIVGTLLGEVLSELPGVIDKVIITGKAAFGNAAKAVVEGQGADAVGAVQCRPPNYFHAHAFAKEPPGAAAQPPTVQYAPVTTNVGSGAASAEVAPATAVTATAQAGNPGPPAAAGPKKPPKTGGCACCCGRSAAAQAVDPAKAGNKAKQPMGKSQAKAKADVKAIAAVTATEAPGPAGGANTSPIASATPAATAATGPAGP
mmetsp:Transcript_68631/g.223275  ORF Transcript_68631/g.223275 Transcript_68631/m.223275 type:complete len:1040 (-) Transcript_68631:212-3331(-)